MKIFVFSDELQWCKENLKFDVPTEFVEGCETDAEEMYLMSICMVGAWLNQNPDKKVFMPPSFILQKNHSVTVNVDRNKRTLIKMPPMLTSIFSQEFQDYEVILIDASTDGSGEICRKCATNKNVTLLTVKRSATKFSAWNKGLDVARGDYVLFLIWLCLK